MPTPHLADPHDAAQLLALVDALVRELHPGAMRRATLDCALDRDLGLDSLSRVELLARIERHYGVRLPTTVLDSAETPRDLLAALADAPAGSPLSQATRRATGDAPASTSTVTDPVSEPSAGMPSGAATLLEVLDWHLARHPERCHVRFLAGDDEVETLSHAELANGARKVAAALRGLGVQPGDCVALMLPTGLDFFRSFFGILFAGAVPVPMYPPARPAQIEEHLRRQAGILRNCAAPVLITFDRVRPLASALAGLAPELVHVTTPAALAASPAASAPAVASAPRHPARARELALIQYTSGSTGDPKGVALSHANLLANIRAWGLAAKVEARDVCVSWLPLYHDMGLIGTWLGSLYHGCTLVLMSPLDFLARPERWLWAIHHYRGTVTAAPNFAYELCIKRLAGTDLAGLDLSSWRLAANGAEPVNPDTLERFAHAFAPYGLNAGSLTPVYGLAECSVGLCVPPPGRGVRIDRVERTPLTREGHALAADGAAGTGAHDDGGEVLRLVSCGPPLPGHELRIVDAEGRPLPERHVGELEFRGPSATAGYYRNPAASAALFHDGWLVTGDHAYLADGELYITGRAKELIIRAGRNLYPYDLEQAIGDLPGVRKGCVAVFGVSDPTSGEERLVVVAETRLEDQAERQALEAGIVAAAMTQLDLAPDAIVLAPRMRSSRPPVARSAAPRCARPGWPGAWVSRCVRRGCRCYACTPPAWPAASASGHARCRAFSTPSGPGPGSRRWPPSPPSASSACPGSVSAGRSPTASPASTAGYAPARCGSKAWTSCPRATASWSPTTPATSTASYSPPRCHIRCASSPRPSCAPSRCCAPCSSAWAPYSSTASTPGRAWKMHARSPHMPKPACRCCSLPKAPSGPRRGCAPSASAPSRSLHARACQWCRSHSRARAPYCAAAVGSRSAGGWA